MLVLGRQMWELPQHPTDLSGCLPCHLPNSNTMYMPSLLGLPTAQLKAPACALLETLPCLSSHFHIIFFFKVLVIHHWRFERNILRKLLVKTLSLTGFGLKIGL